MIDALLAVNEAERLATPGISSVCSTPLANPKRVDFGATASVKKKTLVLSRPTSNAPAVEDFSIIEGELWLSVDDRNKDSEGYGNYILTIDRSKADGGTNTGKIVFSTDNGYKLVVTVTMANQSTEAEQARDAGYIRVRLYNRLTDEIVNKDLDVIDGQYHFEFTGLLAGEYYLSAGSDLDNNSLICGRGESCGRYPELSDPLTLAIDSNKSNIDFPIKILPHAP